jgi:hypothetical protein
VSFRWAGHSRQRAGIEAWLAGGMRRTFLRPRLFNTRRSLPDVKIRDQRPPDQVVEHRIVEGGPPPRKIVLSYLAGRCICGWNGNFGGDIVWSDCASAQANTAISRPVRGKTISRKGRFIDRLLDTFPGGALAQAWRKAASEGGAKANAVDAAPSQLAWQGGASNSQAIEPVSLL